MIRSTKIDEKGRGLSVAKGESLDTVGWVFTLAAWQVVHPEMYFHRKVNIPGHQ